MKHSDGQYIPLAWDCPEGDEPHYVRGHVSEEVARQAANFYDGNYTFRHVYGRWVFSSCDEFDRELRVYSLPQRGAFKMTELRPNA